MKSATTSVGKRSTAKATRAKASNPAVDAVFSAYPRPIRAKLLALRWLIFDTAKTTKGVGALQETLKWGQPSYLTAETKSGSTIRIDQVKSTAHQYAVYHICPNMSPNELSSANALVAAAVKQGLRRFVYHSVLHPQIEAMPHHWAKLRVEEMLLRSGLAVTILQPTAYMQNSLAEWDRMVGDGIYRVPYPIETKLSLVDLNDVAEAAALVLTEAGHSGATYELVGTPPMSVIEIAETFGRALQKDIRAEAEPIEAWNDRGRNAAMDTYQRETLTKMFQAYARDGLCGNPNVLGWLLKRPPTSLASFAARMTSAYA